MGIVVCTPSLFPFVTPLRPFAALDPRMDGPVGGTTPRGSLTVGCGWSRTLLGIETPETNFLNVRAPRPWPQRPSSRNPRTHRVRPSSFPPPLRLSRVHSVLTSVASRAPVSSSSQCRVFQQTNERL